MPNLSLLVRKIKSIQSTSKITDSLKIVSSNKLVVYRNINKKSRDYIWGLSKLFREFFCSPEHFFAESNKHLIQDLHGPTLWIVLGTDIGLCGDYNNKIADYLMSNIDTKDSVAVLGKKLATALGNRCPSQIVCQHSSEIPPTKFVETIEALCKDLLTQFRLKRAGKLVLVYLKNKQLGIVEKLNILPFSKTYFAGQTSLRVKTADYNVDYFTVVSSLFPKYFETLLSSSLVNSKISEHSSRSDLMHTATKNANELLEECKIFYNKMRQSIITQEISEIVAAVQTKK